MEPFDLSLHKVNLEEKDFCEQDSLNAFSDVYCYESDFQTQSNFLPVRAKKVEKKGTHVDINTEKPSSEYCFEFAL